MSDVLTEVCIILVLLLANGVFSMAELAIVSARKSRLRQMSDAGDARAKAALELAESPNTFLATVQIGITLVGVLAAAFSGASLTEDLAEPLRRVPLLEPYADRIAFVLVVTCLTYATLVIGELVPKRLGLGNPEGIARALASPMRKLSVVMGPFVRFLGLSTDALLALFRVKPAQEIAVSEDEVKMLVREGLRAGVFLPAESTMVESVFALDRVPIRDLMTPRAKIIWLNVRDSHEAVWQKIVVSGHTVFPVYAESRDHVVGILSVKAIYANLAAGATVKISDLMTPALAVPASMTATALLEKCKQTGRHVAIVTDEFGSSIGLVSLHDIMEAIIGEIPSPRDRAKPRAVRRDDGTWLVDGMLDASEAAGQIPGFQVDTGYGRDYETFAGLLVKHLCHVPHEGEIFTMNGYRIEVIDMDGHRVDKLLLLPVKPAAQDVVEAQKPSM